MILIPGNAQHIGSRQQQQDAFGFSDLGNAAFRKHAGILAVVADGMGGMAHGDAASRSALKAFLDSYQRKTETEPVVSALERSLLDSNNAVFQHALSLGAAEEMGTTLVAVAIKDELMHWISVGDSAIFVLRDGALTLVNTPHTYAIELDDQLAQGSITAEQAAGHPEREALTSFLGLERLSLIDRSLRPFQLRVGDTVLLASDGLFKTLSEQEMIAAADEDPQMLCEGLLKRTLAAQRPYQDNVTVVALHAAAERPSVATIPIPAAKAAQAAKPQAARERSWLAATLMILALFVVGAYLVFMFSHDSSGEAAAQDAAKKAATKSAPTRDGAPFDPAVVPPLERQPDQLPANPPEVPRQEVAPVEGSKGESRQKPELEEKR